MILNESEANGSMLKMSPSTLLLFFNTAILLLLYFGGCHCILVALNHNKIEHSCFTVQMALVGEGGDVF